jgi:hypothetical protein
MRQMLISLSQCINAWIFRGYADETVSTHCWRSRHKQPFKALRPVIDGLFFILELGKWNHCERSYYEELRRSHLPPELR